MNKKAAAAFCAAAFIAASAAGGACIAARQGVEAAARRAMESLAWEGARTIPGTVSVKLLSGQIVLEGWQFREPGRHAPVLRIGRAAAALSNEALLSFFPLIGRMDRLASQSKVDVFEHVEVSGVELSGPNTPGKVVLKSAKAVNVDMQGKLFADLAEGRDASPLDAVLGTMASSASLVDFEASYGMDGGKGGCGFSSLSASGISGLSFKEALLSGAWCGELSSKVSVAQAGAKNFRFPDGVARRIASFAEKEPSMDDLADVAAEVRRSGPIVSNAWLSGGSLADGSGASASLEGAVFEWKSTEPFESSTRVDGMQIPLSMLGFSLRGLDVFKISAESEDSGQIGPMFPFDLGSWTEKGTVSVPGMFKLSYSMSIAGGAVASASAVLDDNGGTARLAAAAGGADAAKRAVAGFCGGDGIPSCTELLRFVDHPGRLKLSSGQLSGEEIAKAAASGAGKLFSAEAVPGSASLEEQIAALPE